jgi:DNA helicase II / ATP-dependent DNA helicase PcrA
MRLTNSVPVADSAVDGTEAARHDPFANLNLEQRSAVEHGLVDGKLASIPGPLLVIAGAGSGKTLTLASRVARLVLAGADPQRLLLLTFSRRAAREMALRAGRLLHVALGLRATLAPPQLRWAGTFHGIGARLLREYAPQIGLPENFTIADRSDSEDMIAVLRHELGFAATKGRFPMKGACLSIHSRVLNSRAPLADVLRNVFPWCTAWEHELTLLFRAYAAEKQRQCVLDYDDLLLYWRAMLDDAALARHIGARFDHVLVDEYQDTNRLQAEILRALKPDGRGLTVVGDDAQSIYSFRAAEVRNILDFAHGFAPPARVVALERNYRSTQPILDASNAVIALAGERFAKTLWSDAASSQRPCLVTVADESAQAQWVADEVLRQREDGTLLKRQAVLFRTSHHSTALELELARRNIPFVKFGGLKFLAAAHVKDLLSVLRWARNQRHRLAGLRVAQLVPGIGMAGAKRLLDAMDQADDPSTALQAFRPPPAARADWPLLLALLAALRAPDGVAWPQAIELAAAWYLPHLHRLHEDAAVREGDLRQLARLASGFANCDAFLAELTLDPPQATSDEADAPGLDEDYLILSTIHSSKGQEWSAVFVLNAVDGCIPSDMSSGSAAQLDEERRLLYVAMTRARHRLHLMVPQRFYVTQQGDFGDRHLYGALTRFVPPQLAPLFEAAVGAGAPAGSSEEMPPIPQAGFDIDARARSLWK